MPKRMEDSRVAFLLRIRPALKASLVELAKSEHRSLNQQIEFLLERSISKGGQNFPVEPLAMEIEQSRKKH